MSTSDEKFVARPYADLKSPFTVDSSGAFAEYILQDPNTIPQLALGATVLVEDVDPDSSSYWYSGSVVGLKAISPFSPERENLLYIEPDIKKAIDLTEHTTGPHTHQPMIIRISLEQEMRRKEEGGYSIFPIQRPPSARSRMYFPSIDNSENEPSMREILNIRANGLALGNVGFGNIPYFQDEAFLEYKWDIENLDNKHVFIVGESGSGKTLFLKNFAHQIRQLNDKNRVILTDVQGDIVQLLLPNIASTVTRKGWQEKVDIPNLDESIRDLEPFQLIIPARPHGQSSSNTIALKSLAEERGVKVVEVGLRLQDLGMPSDVEYLFRTTSEQVSMLLDDEASGLIQNNQPVTIERLRNQLNQRLQSAGNNQQVSSSAGTSFYKSTFYAALRALKSLASHFDFHQPSMSRGASPLDYFNFDGTTILYLDELDQDERIMWEMQLVRWLYKNKKEDWKAYVFFDEAHQIIPAKPVGVNALGTFERLRVNFERLAREGRKFGINLILSTQNPKDLHPIVPEQCPTRIIMKINPSNAKSINLNDDLAMIANRFGHGQFWIQSPFNGTSEWVRVHSWAPNLPHESMTEFWKHVEQAMEL